MKGIEPLFSQQYSAMLLSSISASTGIHKVTFFKPFAFCLASYLWFFVIVQSPVFEVVTGDCINIQQKEPHQKVWLGVRRFSCHRILKQYP